MDLVQITIFGIAWGLVILFAYRCGAKDERDRQNIAPTAGANIASSKKTFNKKTKTIEQERLSAIMENIDNYDGTGAKQREV